MTAARTYTYTSTHTATQLTEVVLGTIGNILADLGIDATRLQRDWELYENAVKAWIQEGTLADIALECHQPGGAVAPIFEFPVTHRDSGDVAFTASHARMARFRAKLDRVPAGTTFKLVCTFNGPHSSQQGWGPGARASTAGLQTLNFGTLGRAPHGSVGMQYYYS